MRSCLGSAQCTKAIDRQMHYRERKALKRGCRGTEAVGGGGDSARATERGSCPRVRSTNRAAPENPARTQLPMTVAQGWPPSDGGEDEDET